MSIPHFPVPEYPDLQFPGLTFYLLNQKAPNFITSAKWFVRLCISFVFLIMLLIMTLFFEYHDLFEDILDLSALAVLFFLYILSISLFTPVFLNSEYVKNMAIISKKHFIYRELAKTPRKKRLIVANNILNALKSNEWRLYINYANTIDSARTIYCCKKIEKIALDLGSNDPTRFTAAILKTMHNQRGGIFYLFDIFIILTDQHFIHEHKKGRKIRKTMKLMIQNDLTHLH